MLQLLVVIARQRACSAGLVRGAAFAQAGVSIEGQLTSSRTPQHTDLPCLIPLTSLEYFRAPHCGNDRGSPHSDFPTFLERGILEGADSHAEPEVCKLRGHRINTS